MSNATCFAKHAPLKEPPLVQNGQIKFPPHFIGWIVSALLTIVAVVVSVWLICKHLTWYSNKRQQRYIVRLLFMVPIYAIVSLTSYIFWNQAIPITLARDSYEAFVLYCFFYLLLQYLSPTTEGQKEVFRHVTLKKWVFPMGFVKYRPVDGLYFLQLMKWGVLQYCVIRPTTTLVAVILDAVGLYCDSSWSLGWGHPYITVLVSISVSIAMFCLIQLYVPVSAQLAPHKPLLKLFSIKAVVFLTFWQATGLSLLSLFGVIKDTNYMTANDINTGIAAILETFEMMCFAFLHIYAFSYLPYQEGKGLSDKTPLLKSLIHVLNPRDMWHEFRDGSVYMGRTMRGLEAEVEFRKRIHFARVMGRERELSSVKGGSVADGEEDMLLDSPGFLTRNDKVRMWLNDPRDQFGAGFQDEVERELRQRELDRDLESPPPGHQRGQTSWWRGVYHRFFPSRTERVSEEPLSPIPRRSSHINRYRKRNRESSRLPSLDSPPPPPAVLYEYALPGKGRSVVRLSSPQRDADEAESSQRRSREQVREPNLISPRLGRHETELSTGRQVPPRGITSPRPGSASQIRVTEFLASKDEPISSERELPKRPEHGGDSSPHILQLDSPPRRVVPALKPLVVNELPASQNGATSTSPWNAHSTKLSSPQALPSLPPDIPTQIERRRADPMSTEKIHTGPNAPVAQSASWQMSSPRTSNSWKPEPGLMPPRRGRPRPEIVLPAPLAPTRHPIEPARHGHSTATPYMRTSAVASSSHPLSPTYTNVDQSSLPLPPPDDNRNSRHRSAETRLPQNGQQRPVKRKSVPIVDVDDTLLPQTPLTMTSREETQRVKRSSVPAVDENLIPQPQSAPAGRSREMLPDLPPLDLIPEGDVAVSADLPLRSRKDVPQGSGPGSPLTTSPSTPRRILRHAGHDISKTGRRW